MSVRSTAASIPQVISASIIINLGKGGILTIKPSVSQAVEPPASSPPQINGNDDDDDLCAYFDWLKSRHEFDGTGLMDVQKKLSSAGYEFRSLKEMEMANFKAISIGKGWVARIRRLCRERIASTLYASSKVTFFPRWKVM